MHALNPFKQIIIKAINPFSQLLMFKKQRSSQIYFRSFKFLSLDFAFWDTRNIDGKNFLVMGKCIIRCYKSSIAYFCLKVIQYIIRSDIFKYMYIQFALDNCFVSLWYFLSEVGMKPSYFKYYNFSDVKACMFLQRSHYKHVNFHHVVIWFNHTSIPQSKHKFSSKYIWPKL